MKTWPMVRQLGFVFPENRIIRATHVAIQWMPLLALPAALSQVHFYGMSFLPQALTIALFFLSLPLQGLWWLGHRARQPLPLSLMSFGNRLQERLSAIGVKADPLGAKACYLDMAILLKIAFERFDANYWEEL